MAFVTLVLFFILEYVRPTSFFPALTPLHLNSVVPLMAVVFSLVSSGDHRLKEPAGDRNMIFIGILIGLLAISIPFAALSDPALKVFESVLGYGLVSWVVAREVTTFDRLATIFRTLILIHVVVVLLSPQILLDPASRTHVIASGSFLGDGNDFALSVNVVIPFCLFLLFGAKRLPSRIVHAVMLLLLVVCVIASQSRGGTLALLATGAYFWLRSGKKLTFGMLAIAALGVILIYAPPSYFDRMDTIANPADGSAQGRLISWTYAWNIALQSPILGVGAGNFPYLHHQTAHSIYFLILGELGFPGLIVLISLIAWNLGANRRLSAELKRQGNEAGQQLLASLSCSLLAFAIGGAFLSAIYYPHAYVLAGLLTAGRRIALAGATGSVAPVIEPASRPPVSLHWALARPEGARSLTR